MTSYAQPSMTQFGVERPTLDYVIWSGALNPRTDENPVHKREHCTPGELGLDEETKLSFLS